MKIDPAPVLDRDELAQRIASDKEAGKRVVFSNGTFDLVHVGHIRSLADAASHGDVLVVAINSDASVRAYKSPDLPIQPEAERAEVIAALRFVDYVTIFEEPTVDNLITLLEPHVMAKGREYEPSTIPERPTVEAYGGEIAIVGDDKAHSTSWLIKRIRALKD